MEQGMEKAYIPQHSVPEVFEKFQAEVDRYERLLNDAHSMLKPVINQSSLHEDRRPQEAPYTDYHGLVLRLEGLNDTLGEVIQSVKL